MNDGEIGELPACDVVVGDEVFIGGGWQHIKKIFVDCEQGAGRTVVYHVFVYDAPPNMNCHASYKPLTTVRVRRQAVDDHRAQRRRK